VGKSLVIVESPTKAKTISKFLGKDYVVESSIGHIRDLPKSANEIPESHRDKEWARLGIDIENGFEPLYVVPSDKKKQVSKLKSLLKEADDLYLATDEDREGESISWHLCQVLRPKVPQKRLVFHEITREAIQKALQNPRQIDERLVRAQETRRILDRLYGYEISPLLWKKIRPKLSAGRVQSVAVRMVVERERERMVFVRSNYWDLIATFAAADGKKFDATLVQIGGQRIASGKDFDEATGRLSAESASKVVLLDAKAAQDLVARLGRSTWKVLRVERKPYATRPSPPFTTSTLQQESNRKFRLSAQETMRAAQRLYENGWITYMRTDSVQLSEEAVRRARDVASELYGKDHVAPQPRQYQTKVKNAQEAHEAIRPSSDFHRPESLRDQLNPVEFKLYELIWKRTVACQMAEARGQRISVQVGDGHAVFQASGKTIEFAGFLRAYVEGADDPDAEIADQETLLPDLAEGAGVRGERIEAKEHTTQPPARYTEASLVKALEANGVGRPSTYASIIETILRREYVIKQSNALVPTFTAFAVTQLLERFFARLVDIQFTANMEDDLDEISLGDKESIPYLRAFYFGDQKAPGLKELLASEIDPRASCTIELGKDFDDRTINIRVGKFGPYLERGDDKASLPEGLAPDELTIAKACELLEKGSGPQSIGVDPETGKPIFVRIGRYGAYVQLGTAEDGEKPKNKSLLPGMKPEELTLEEALRLLSLPRTLGEAPTKEGETSQVIVDFGRYGPYVKLGTEFRSLKKEDDVFTITLERARELLAEERAPRKWGAKAKPAPLREVGKRPGSETPIQLYEGRYGPYVSDGETNASLRDGDTPDTITLDRALELIEERAASLGSRGRKTSRKTAATKKAGTGKKAAATKKAALPSEEPLATETPALGKKAASTKKAAPSKKAASTKKAASSKKAASTKKSGIGRAKAVADASDEIDDGVLVGDGEND
jgi:DNA topoisomerase-1